MRVVYNGYAATTYGPSSLSITDRTGREVINISNRPKNIRTEEDLKRYLKEFLKEVKG